MKRIVLASLLGATLVHSEVLFHKGDISLGIGVGNGSVSYEVPSGDITNDYFIFGVGADYFFMDNISVGVSLWHWSGDSPSVTQYTLPFTYYLDTGSRLSPYAGVFYRYTNYSGSLEDRYGIRYSVDATHSAGVRAGVAYSVSFGYLGIGIVAEKSSDGGETSTYPEMSIGFVF